MKFDRLLRDSQRRGAPPFSEANENAKTQALEGLLGGSGPHAIADGRGQHSRRDPAARLQRMVFFRLSGYTVPTELGGGRYWAHSYFLDDCKWNEPKNNRLEEAMLGLLPPDTKRAPDTEVWHIPELGTDDHNLQHDPTLPDVVRGLGMFMNYDYWNRKIVVLPQVATPEVARIQVTALVSSGVYDGKRYKTPSTLDTELTRFVAHRTHSLGSETIIVKPFGRAVGGVYDWEEVLEMPDGGVQYQVIQRPAGGGPWVVDWVRGAP